MKKNLNIKINELEKENGKLKRIVTMLEKQIKNLKKPQILQEKKELNRVKNIMIARNKREIETYFAHKPAISYFNP